MIYTCYEMIRDCRADTPEGWSYFLAQYVPVIRALVAHYFPGRSGDPALVERVLVALRQPQSKLFESLEPAPERAFVTGLRQRVLAAVEEIGQQGSEHRQLFCLNDEAKLNRLRRHGCGPGCTHASLALRRPGNARC